MDLDKLILFTGRFHPIVVHLPIGFLLIVFILEAMSQFKRFENFKYSTSIILVLGIASSILAAVMGYLLSLGGGYDEKILFWHQWLGIAVAVVSLIAYVLKRVSIKKPSKGITNSYLGLLTLTVVLLMIAGHYGGSLTHGSEYLTEHAPDFSSEGSTDTTKKVSVKKVKNVKEALLYRDVLQPILDEKCTSCHNGGKKKGGLRLDNAQELMKGGDKGIVIVPGKIEQSEFYHRLLLPEDNKGHMPPKGKTAFTDKEMELFAWWISEGAPTDKKIAELPVPAKLETEIKKMLNVGNEKSGIYLLKVPRVDEKIINGLDNKGILTTRLSEETSFLNVQLAEVADTFQNQHLKLLNPVSQQVTWLHLGGTKITDEGLSDVSKMTHLTRLYLQNTNVTDEGLKKLEDLKYLEYLNLYGTQVTDQGLGSLQKMKSLKSVFLWKTPVTAQAIKSLKQKLPELKVNAGLPEGPKSNYIELGKGWKFKTGDNKAWASPDTKDDKWENIEVGKRWQDAGHDHAGFAWYRTKIILSDTLQKYVKKEGDLKLILGMIDDVDETFVNGKMIGHTGKIKPYTTAYNENREYILSANDIKWGQENIIAVRVYSPDKMGGGMVSGAYQLYINIYPQKEGLNEEASAGAEETSNIVAFDEGSCCDKAKKAGKECEHQCCVDARKKGKVCTDCNPKSKN